QREAAVGEERARIARELHDVVGQALSVVSAQAGAARIMLDDDPELAKAPLDAVQDASAHAAEGMRPPLALPRAAGAPDPGPQAGLHDLDALVDRVVDAGVRARLDADGLPDALPAGLDLAAYRIVQEALTNVLKHAPGADATVTLRVRPAAIEIEVV